MPNEFNYPLSQVRNQANPIFPETTEACHAQNNGTPLTLLYHPPARYRTFYAAVQQSGVFHSVH